MCFGKTFDNSLTPKFCLVFKCDFSHAMIVGFQRKTKDKRHKKDKRHCDSKEKEKEKTTQTLKPEFKPLSSERESERGRRHLSMSVPKPQLFVALFGGFSKNWQTQGNGYIGDIGDSGDIAIAIKKKLKY